MTALFTKAKPFTVVSANQGETGPASNAGQVEPGLVWLSANLTTPYVVLDLGPGAGAYDTLALIGTNLRASDTVRIRTGTDSTGIGNYDSGVRAAWVGNKPEGWSSKSLFTFNARAERYVRIDLNAPGHPNGFTEVAYIVVGKSLTTLGIDIDAEQSIVDNSAIQSIGGFDIVEEAPAQMSWKFSMSWVDDASWRNEWLSFVSDVRKVKPVLFVPILDDPTTWQQDMAYGRFRNDPAAKASSKLKRALDIKLTGMML